MQQRGASSSYAADETPANTRGVAAASTPSSSSMKQQLDDAFYQDVGQERQRFVSDMDRHINKTYVANVEEEMQSVTRSVGQHLSAVEETVEQCKFLQSTELQKITAVLGEVTAMVAVNDDIRAQFVKLFDVQQNDFHRYEEERRNKFLRDIEALYREYGIDNEAVGAYTVPDADDDGS